QGVFKKTQEPWARWLAGGDYPQELAVQLSQDGRRELNRVQAVAQLAQGPCACQMMLQEAGLPTPVLRPQRHHWPVGAGPDGQLERGQQPRLTASYPVQLAFHPFDHRLYASFA